MHLIAEAIGGRGSADNLIPAPTATNRSARTGFEANVERLLFGTNNPRNAASASVFRRNIRQAGNAAVVWVDARTTGWHPADPNPIDGVPRYGANVFATGVAFRAGLYSLRGTTWVKSAATIQLDVAIDAPDLTQAFVPNINTVGSSTLIQALGISRRMADLIVRDRGTTAARTCARPPPRTGRHASLPTCHAGK